MQIIIKKDGKGVAKVPDPNAAFAWLIKNQGQSVDYAITYGGYSAETETGIKVIQPARKGGK